MSEAEYLGFEVKEKKRGSFERWIKAIRKDERTKTLKQLKQKIEKLELFTFKGTNIDLVVKDEVLKIIEEMEK